MEYILFAGFAESALLSILILTKPRQNRSDRILAAYFLLHGLNMGLNFFEAYNRHHGYPWPALILTTAPLILLHGPVLWLYIKSLTDSLFKWRRIYLLHFIPFIAMTTHNYWDVYSLPSDEKIALVASESFKNQTSFFVWTVVIAVSNLGYLIWGMLLVSNHRRKIEQYYSATEGIDLQWLRLLLTSALILYSIVNGLFVANAFTHFADVLWLQVVTFVVGAFFILFIGLYGHRQGSIFTQPRVKEFISNVDQPTVLENPLPTADELFISKLMNHMDEAKPWLDAELTIGKLAESLHVQPEYLSGILNRHLHRNFFDFVNHYRISEFKKRCCHPDSERLTLVGIAFDCGFNSKATFNRVFKRITSITPSAYKAQVSEK